MKYLEPTYKNYNPFFILYKNVHTLTFTKTEKVYFIKNPARTLKLYNPFKFIKSFFQAYKILQKEKPKFIISTGAGIAVPVCYAGKLLRIKIIFVVTSSSIYKLNLSARLIYPISNLFIVQYKNFLKKYKKAIFRGNLYDFC